MVRSVRPHLFVLAAGIALAGCASNSAPPPSVAQVSSRSSLASSQDVRPGQGLVESISLPAPSASAGGTTPTGASGPYRVTVRMEDGSVQTVMIDSRAFLVGDRVQITSGGRLNRL